MMLAQLETVPSEAIKNFALIILALLGAAYYVKEIFFKGKNEITPQPLAIQLVEELHEQFASKKDFMAHTANNTARHSQLFSEIKRVENEGRERLEKRFEDLSQERQLTLEKLNHQFTFIRENIAEIKTELKVRHES